MSARSFRGLFDFIIGAGADPPLVQPQLNADVVGFNYQVADIEQTLPARRGIRILGTVITTAAAASNSAVEVQTLNSGMWVRRMRQVAGTNWQWQVNLFGATSLNVTDPEPIVQVMVSNEGSTIATAFTQLSTQLPNRIAIRAGRSTVIGSGIFETSGTDPFHELTPIWVPPTSMLLIQAITQNVALSVSLDLELPVRGADVTS